MKNKEKGFVIPLIIAIIALLAIGGGVYVYTNKKTVTPPVVNIPKVVNTVPAPIIKDEPKTVATTSTTTTVVKPKTAPVINTDLKISPTTTTNDDLWSVFDKVKEALKNKDATAYNVVSYTQVTPAQIAQFAQMATFLYDETVKINKADFVNKWQDDKQAIYSTNPVKIDDATSYGYNQKQITFVKISGSWKVLMISPEKNWGVSKSGTNKTASQVEVDLQAMMIDSDKDGLTNEEEICAGADQYNSQCVKTDPNKRDTNGNGWWDEIEKDMK